MVSVTVYNRNGTKAPFGHHGTKEFESGEHETVGDVKRMLDSGGPEEMQLAFQNEILEDSTVLATLGEEVELMVEWSMELAAIDEVSVLSGPRYEPLGAEPGVEEIDPRLCSGLVNRITCAGCAQPLDGHVPPAAAPDKSPRARLPADYFTLNGRTYRITRRRKRLTLKNIVEKFEAFFTPALLFQCLMLLFILHTNNVFVLVVLLSIRSMRMLSSLVRRHRLWAHVRKHGMQAFFMFFASLVLIDHPSFYRPSSEGSPHPAPDE